MRKRSKLPALLIVAGVLLLAVGFMAVFWGSITARLKKAMLPLEYVDEIKSAADSYGLDRRLVAAVVNTESGFDPEAVSVDGAEGLMQLLPSTAQWIADMRGVKLADGALFDPETNIEYGCWLLRYLLDRYDDEVRYALIAYNAGVGRLDGWLETETDENGELSVIPYAETRNYVKKVMSLIEAYGEYYEAELMD